MDLGTLIRRLEHDGDAATALAELGDLALLAAVQDVGENYDETPGAYVAGAVRRFANQASSDEWLELMTALARADDPARCALERMVRWALGRDTHAHGLATG
jgi:hypothetical protein